MIVVLSLALALPPSESNINCGGGLTVETAGCGMDAQVKDIPAGMTWEEGCKRCLQTLASSGLFDDCGGTGWCALPTDRFGRPTYGIWLKAHATPSPPPPSKPPSPPSTPPSTPPQAREPWWLATWWGYLMYAACMFLGIKCLCGCAGKKFQSEMYGEAQEELRNDAASRNLFPQGLLDAAGLAFEVHSTVRELH